MSVRPTLLKDIRRDAINNHRNSTGTGNYNRYQLLSPRDRTFSAGKRQLEKSDCDAESAAKAPKLDSNLIFDQLKGQDAVLDEIDSSLASLDKASTDANTPKDPRLDVLLQVVKLLATSQRNLTSAILDSAKLNTNSTPVTANAAVSSKGGSAIPGAGTDINTGTGKRSAPALSPEEAAEKKVKRVLHDAEKKTVLFNMNLGKNPLMNKESISRKVTESLCASVKSGQHDFNIKDAEEILDDILSCSKLEFLGNSTKLFFNNRNPSDARNNKMYSVPVRMDFRDRDTRFEAEIMLRKLCKVNCSVPYPKKMRALLNEVVKDGKKLQPDCFIRTKVNVDKLTVEAHAKTASGWLDLGIKRSIPTSILDNSTLDNQESMMTGELPEIS
jgi:hypothetical protein